jgi:hypothetical protein
MWTNKRVLTFVENLQPHACLWDVQCAQYKNCNKKGDAINLIEKKKYGLCIIEVEKKSPTSKVSS